MNHAYKRVLLEKGKYLTRHNFLLFCLQKHVTAKFPIVSFEKNWWKTGASCFMRGSKHLETIKALGLRPRAFITFSVFGTPDETLALVFDIVLKDYLSTGMLCERLLLFWSCRWRKWLEKSKGFGALGGLKYNLLVKIKTNTFSLKLLYVFWNSEFASWGGTRELYVQVLAVVCVMTRLKTISCDKIAFYLLFKQRRRIFSSCNAQHTA